MKRSPDKVVKFARYGREHPYSSKPTGTSRNGNFRLKGDDAEYLLDTNIDPRTWLPGDTVESAEIKLPDEIPSGKYTVEFRLGGDKYPTVKFATDTERSEDGYHLLTSITINQCLPE